MNEMKILILSILLISNISSAQDAIFLDKDKSAPFSGYLLPEDKVKELRNNTIERDLYKTEVDLRERQVKLLNDQNDKLALTLQSTSSLSNWEKVGYFIGGVLITGLAVNLAHQIYR